MTKLKAVIMDGDGSTITHDGILPDNLRELIVANPQVKWIMATGRSLDLLRRLPIIDYLSTDVPHIVDGGSRLVNQNGESIADFFISHDEIDLFFSQLDLQKVDFLYYYLDEKRSYIYSQQIEHWSQRPQFSSAQATSDIAIYRAWAKENQPTKIFIRVLQDIELKGLSWHQNERNIDLTAHGVNKGSTCSKLLTMLNLHPSEVAFVFNDRNDLPLVEHPELNEIVKIKVGDYLPDTPAEFHVATPYDVADVLQQLI